MADREAEDSTEQIAEQIAKQIAGRPPSRGEITVVIEGIRYLAILVENERTWPPRAEQRAQLSRVAELATELAALLGKPLGLSTARERRIEPAADALQLALPEIAREFTAAARAVPEGRGRAWHVPNPDGDTAKQATARVFVKIYAAVHGEPPGAHTDTSFDACARLLAAAGESAKGWGDKSSGWRVHIRRAIGRMSVEETATARARIRTVNLLDR